MAGYDTVTLMTDRGQVDEAVGVVRSILADMAPSANVVDLTHGIERHDVRAGALALARSVPYIAPGIVLASVDPDGSSQRRSIAVEIGDGVGVMVGSDNGLLANAVAIVGGAGRTVELTDERYRLPSAGSLWELRDVLAPAAAHLCEGVDLAELGPAIDPASLLPSLVPIPRFENEQVLAEVMWVDHFGRVQLNLEAEMIDHLGNTIVTTINSQQRVVMRHRSINDVPDGQVGLVTDTFGLMALVSPQRSAAAEFDIDVGAEVVLSEAR
ncbi:MAG: SAM-dependent chlorinase/fluorinase [Actinobacteria bacterium]|nr:SAM-dependent chlorinase/fluorinase [Actinomycetota bacterium]